MKPLISVIIPIYKVEKYLERATITFRTRVNGRATLGKVTNWYCKDTKCAGKDQMAHEG